MKKLFSILLAIVISFCMSVSVIATETPMEGDVAPCLEYAKNVKSYLTIASDTATCTSKITGISGTTTKILVIQTLQKKSGSTWGDIAVWSDVYIGTSYTFINTKTSLSSGSFRVKTYAKIYSGSSYETTTEYSGTVTNS